MTGEYIKTVHPELPDPSTAEEALNSIFDNLESDELIHPKGSLRDGTIAVCGQGPVSPEGELNIHCKLNTIAALCFYFDQACTIAVSGGCSGPEGTPPEAYLMAQMLINAGVDSSDIVIENEASNTIGNALEMAEHGCFDEYFKNNGFLCTIGPDFHTKRIEYVFNALGIDASVFASEEVLKEFIKHLDNLGVSHPVLNVLDENQEAVLRALEIVYDPETNEEIKQRYAEEKRTMAGYKEMPGSLLKSLGQVLSADAPREMKTSYIDFLYEHEKYLLKKYGIDLRLLAKDPMLIANALHRLNVYFAPEIWRNRGGVEYYKHLSHCQSCTRVIYDLALTLGVDFNGKHNNSFEIKAPPADLDELREQAEFEPEERLPRGIVKELILPLKSWLESHPEFEEIRIEDIRWYNDKDILLLWSKIHQVLLYEEAKKVNDKRVISETPGTSNTLETAA